MNKETLKKAKELEGAFYRLTETVKSLQKALEFIKKSGNEKITADINISSVGSYGQELELRKFYIDLDLSKVIKQYERRIYIQKNLLNRNRQQFKNL